MAWSSEYPPTQRFYYYSGQNGVRMAEIKASMTTWCNGSESLKTTCKSECGKSRFSNRTDCPRGT